MNKNGYISGFSLLELLVVLTILSIAAFGAVPYLNIKSTVDGHRTISELMASLKQKAIQENKTFLLHIDQLSGEVWITQDSQESLNITPQKREPLLNLSIDHIEVKGQNAPEETVIRFYNKGYSDMALIQMRSGDEEFTLKLHPFFANVEIIKGYVFFDDCI